MTETRRGKARGSRRSEAVEDLSFQDARSRLDAAIASLQSSDLDVEQMAELYRQARGYAERCEAVLQAVEQDVIEWEANPSTTES